MDFIIAVWDCMGRNAGQIQIFIAVVALVYAWKAYRKVLEQIHISNKQTELSLKQTNISIAQMDRLNDERLFELNLRIKNIICESKIEISLLYDEYERLSKNVFLRNKEDDKYGGFDSVEENLKTNMSKISDLKIKLTRLEGELVINKHLNTYTNEFLEEKLMDIFSSKETYARLHAEIMDIKTMIRLISASPHLIIT